MSYTIIETPNYYAGQVNSPSTHRLSMAEAYPTPNFPPSAEDEQTVAIFETEAEAEAIVDELKSGPYYCSNGEAGRPGYEIVSDEDARPDDTIYRPDALGDAYECIDDIDIPVSTESLNAHIEYWGSYTVDYGIYRGEIVEHDGVKYLVAYVVSMLAVQEAEGDLSCLNWDHPIYYRIK